MRSVEQIAEQLRKKGLKLTPQRRLIIDILLHDRTHPTVEEVYRKVLETMPEVSRTTVYNTIREMLNLGEVAEGTRSERRWNSVRYNGRAPSSLLLRSLQGASSTWTLIFRRWRSLQRSFPTALLSSSS